MTDTFIGFIGGMCGGIVALAGSFLQGWLQRTTLRDERENAIKRTELVALQEKRMASYSAFAELFLSGLQARYSDIPDVRESYLKYVQTVEYVNRLSKMLGDLELYASTDVLNSVYDFTRFLNDICHPNPTDDELLQMQERLSPILTLMRADVPGLRLHDEELGYRFIEPSRSERKVNG